jgi:hypothetical protein
VRTALALLAAILPSLASPADPAGGLSAADQGVAGLMLIHDDCVRAAPEIAPRLARGYQEWRERHKAAIARIDAAKGYREQLARDQARIPQAAPTHCEELLAMALDIPPLAVPASPMEAWTGFLAALRAGDREKALAHYVPGARARYRPVVEELSPEALRKMAESFSALEGLSTSEQIAFGFVTRAAPDGTRQAFEIAFMRDRRSGGWYIESM